MLSDTGWKLSNTKTISFPGTNNDDAGRMVVLHLRVSPSTSRNIWTMLLLKFFHIGTRISLDHILKLGKFTIEKLRRRHDLLLVPCDVVLAVFFAKEGELVYCISICCTSSSRDHHHHSATVHPIWSQLAIVRPNQSVFIRIQLRVVGTRNVGTISYIRNLGTK